MNLNQIQINKLSMETGWINDYMMEAEKIFSIKKYLTHKMN